MDKMHGNESSKNVLKLKSIKMTIGDMTFM